MSRVIACLLGLFFPVLLRGQSQGLEERRLLFAEEAGRRVLPQPNVRGDDPDWFFLVKELKHLSGGRFWEKPWSEVATNGSDPVPSILEFNSLLEKRGIRLVLVPVPAKAAIYPDKLAGSFAPVEVEPHAPFLDRIREAGVTVVDLEAPFREARVEHPDRWLYCRQDAHFSPAAIELLVSLLPVDASVAETAPSNNFPVGDPASLSFAGDQVIGSEWENSVAHETVDVRFVSHDGKVGVVPDPESSVLILGDSHTLVFHAGKEAGMHCTGAGVADHLAARLGFVPDLVGVRGSGLVQARKQLFYKATANPGYWSKKKVVIWLFSVREFTQSSDRLISIPIDR